MFTKKTKLKQKQNWKRKPCLKELKNFISILKNFIFVYKITLNDNLKHIIMYKNQWKCDTTLEVAWS